MTKKDKSIEIQSLKTKTSSEFSGSSKSLLGIDKKERTSLLTPSSARSLINSNDVFEGSSKTSSDTVTVSTSKSVSTKHSRTPIDSATISKILQEYNSLIKYEVEYITDALAKRYLDSNIYNKKTRIQNRKINHHTHARFVSDMINGTWLLGSPIIFDENGVLIDGQTRCSAIRNACSTGKIDGVFMGVLKGIPASAFGVMDCGKTRTLKDGLTTLFIPTRKGDVKLTNPTSVGVAIHFEHNIKHGGMHIDKNRILSTPTVINMVENNFWFYEEPFSGGQKSKISGWRKNINFAIGAPFFATFYYLYTITDGKNVDSFLDLMTSKTNIPPIILNFREKILANKGNKMFKNKYMDSTTILKSMIVLYKYYKDGTLNSKKNINLSDFSL